MKILLIEPCFENFGGYHRAYGIAKALSGKGIYVDLLISSSKKLFMGIDRERVNDHLAVYKLPRIYVNYFITGRIMRAAIASLFALFGRYDIVHLFALVQFESNIPFLMSTLLGKKTVVDWDDYWTDAHILAPMFEKCPPIKWYLRFCEYTIQKLARHGTATSEFLLNEYRTIGVGHTHKIINCVNRDQFTPMDRESARRKLGIPLDEKILLTFGNTFFAERTVHLFTIFSKIYARNQAVKLYINQDPTSLLQQEGKSLSIPMDFMENVKNVGFLDRDKLALYVGACDAIIFVMGDSTLEKACFPTRIGTYINGGRAIITNHTETEAGRVLREHKCAVIGADCDDIADKALAYLSDADLQKEIEGNAVRARQDLSWESLIDGLVAFYRQI